VDVGQQLLGEVVSECQQNGSGCSGTSLGHGALLPDRFSEWDVWISSHRLRIWLRSRLVAVFMVAACLSSESVCGRTL